MALEVPFELGYARWRQAEALIVGGGDRAPPRTPCARPPASPRRLRAPLLAAEVDGPRPARARAARHGARRRARGDPERRPPRAHRARAHASCALVAEGHTNREIGETLFISEKTASVHVSRILAKLGVRSRVEAATTAHRLGLV